MTRDFVYTRTRRVFVFDRIYRISNQDYQDVNSCDERLISLWMLDRFS